MEYASQERRQYIIYVSNLHIMWNIVVLKYYEFPYYIYYGNTVIDILYYTDLQCCSGAAVKKLTTGTTKLKCIVPI